jgi:signal transduction histidine kinase
VIVAAYAAVGATNRFPSRLIAARCNLSHCLDVPKAALDNGLMKSSNNLPSSGSPASDCEVGAISEAALESEPRLLVWLGRNWWRLAVVSVLLMVACAVSLQMLFPRLSVWEWFFVVAILGGALEMSFLVAYFASGRAARKQSPLQRGLWGAAGGIIGAVSVQIGAQIGSGQFTFDSIFTTFTRKEVWAVLIIAMVAAAIVTVFYVLIAKLQARQSDLELQKAYADADRERLAKRNTEAELKLMQAQVEPHFLYNTLANLRYLAESGSPRALEMVDHLIEYLRLSLPGFRNDSTTLRNELDLARAYLAIMQIRMGSKLKSRIDVDNHLLNVQLPPLMLLTLIENAVKHGVGCAPAGGEIVVSARAVADYIELKVADTGAGFAQAEMANNRRPSQHGLHVGIGLTNIRERLDAIYGGGIGGAQLTLVANEPAGVIAKIIIPRNVK